jgi:hypothetical protein
MADRYFSRREAESLLPMIGEYLDEARKHKEAVDGLEEEITRETSRIMLVGGCIPPYSKISKVKNEHALVTARLEAVVEKIQDTGCLVKDLDVGLVDFPTLRGGEEVYLCWKLGEERITFWHGTEEGFAGRKPLDEDEPPGNERVQ